MRYSLRDLMVVVTFCAGIAWCASQVGYDDGLFWFIVGVIAIASTLFVLVARSQRGPLWVLWATIPFLVVSYVSIISLPLVTDAAILSLAAPILAPYGMPSVRTLCNIAMAGVLASLVPVVMLGMIETRRIEAVLKELPVASLSARLQYERRHQPSADASYDATRLVTMECSQDENTYRRFQLERLHKYQNEVFTRAAGFGIQRVIPLTPDSLRRSPLHDIRFDATETEANSGLGGWRYFRVAGNKNGVEGLHSASRNDFLDPDGFGVAIEPPLKVKGFAEHGFHYPPLAAMDNPADWSLDRLELVSLLKFGTPRVYVLDHLPRMDQLSGDNVPTRALDEFESDALKQLQTTEDLVVKQNGSEYRMLGSLRAARQCLECHSVQRGELLGAFSYVLHGPAVVGH